MTLSGERLGRWLCALAAALLLGCGCSGSPHTEQALQSAVVHNPGTQSVRFNLAINGARFFDDDVLLELGGAVPPGDDDGFAQALPDVGEV